MHVNLCTEDDLNMTRFIIIGSVATKEETIEINIIAKNAIVRNRIKEITKGV